MNYTPIHVYSDKELSDVIANVKILEASKDFCKGELI
jgi:hypothetical protein